MRRLLQGIIGLCAAVLATVVGIVVFWLRSDPATWRNALERLASEQLGRQLLIAGELKPGFSIAEGLTLDISDLRLANAPGFEPAAMLVVPKLEIAVDLRALVSSTIHIRGLRISGATLTLARNAAGADNWTFNAARTPAHIAAAGSAAEITDGRAFAFDAANVTADDLLINYSTPGALETLLVKNLAMEAPADAPFKVRADVQHNRTAYAVYFTAGSLQALLDGTRQPVALQLRAPVLVQPLRLDATYTRHELLHRFDNLHVQADGLDATGEAAVTTGGPRPRVTLKLAAPLLDLLKFAMQAGAAGNAAPAPIFSRTPLPWALLASLDLDGTLAVDHVKRGGADLGPLHIDAQLTQSRLAATVIAQPPGATQPVKLDLTATAGQEATVLLTAPAIDPTLWAGFLGGPASGPLVQSPASGPLVQSPASITLNLAGHGAAPHDLAATARGTAAFAALPGKLNAAAIPDGIRRALDAVLGAGALDKASLACLKAGFNVQDGVMRASGNAAGIGLDSNVMAISGDGQADLGTETIALRLVVAPRLPGLMQTLIPLHVTGALGDPRISADLSAAAGQVAGQLFGKLAETLPTARLGLAAAKAIRRDSGGMIAQPPNPCVADTAPVVAPAIVPDAVTQPSDLPPAVRKNLKGARDLLDQFIKATEPPAPAAAVQ